MLPVLQPLWPVLAERARPQGGPPKLTPTPAECPVEPSAVVPRTPDGPMGTASGCVCVHLAWAVGSVAKSRCCMHSAELRTAATKGDTKTVVALLARGEDVHCKGTDGYGSQAASSGRYFGTVSGRTVRPRVELPDALQEQHRVRFSGCILASLVCRSFGPTVRPRGVGLQVCLFGLCRRTALHWASQNGKTQTAVALFLADADALCPSKDGYDFGAASGHSGEPHFFRQFTAGGLRQSASRALGVYVSCAWRWVCCWHCSPKARCAAFRRKDDGTAFSRYFMHRLTALEAELHSAFVRAETAMVLVGIGTLKAGADVHGKDHDGYGPAL
jgi:hypothetical protein